MAKPITPKEAEKSVVTSIPEEVIEIFNKLITEGYRNGSARVYQSVVIEAIQFAFEEKVDPFAKGWLDIESLFEKSGWKVTYESPAYCDNWFDPYWTFRKK